MSRKVIALAVASCLAILGVWYLVLWSPQSSSLKKAQTAVAASVGKEQVLKRQVDSLVLQRTKLPAMQAQLAQISLALPKVADADKLINDVNAAASHSGVLLANFSPTTPSGASAAGVASIGLNLSVSGTYQQIIDFVNRLNAMPRLAVVDSISFPSPDPAGKMTVGITARVFMQSPLPKAAVTPTTIKGSP